MGRYLYKGRDVELKARKILNIIDKNKKLIENQNRLNFYIYDYSGEGELALILALLYPGAKIYCRCYDEESSDILRGCIKDFTNNIVIVEDKLEDEADIIVIGKDRKIPKQNYSMVIYT